MLSVSNLWHHSGDSELNGSNSNSRKSVTKIHKNSYLWFVNLFENVFMWQKCKESMLKKVGTGMFTTVLHNTFI